MDLIEQVVAGINDGNCEPDLVELHRLVALDGMPLISMQLFDGSVRDGYPDEIIEMNGLQALKGLSTVISLAAGMQTRIAEKLAALQDIELTD